MNKKVYWTLGLALVGLFLAEKQTYWLSVTYVYDVGTLALGACGGAVVGFFLACIVQNTTDERSRRFKILYWLLVMTAVGSFLGFGKGVPAKTTVTVMAWTLGIGFIVGLLQYFLQSKKMMR
jgi:hypothetical membrane protein